MWGAEDIAKNISEKNSWEILANVWIIWKFGLFNFSVSMLKHKSTQETQMDPERKEVNLTSALGALNCAFSISGSIYVLN